jgi:endonuclease YncB( thermonuclease family)
MTHPIPTQLWTVRARLERAVDGDTDDVTLDLGHGIYLQHRLRLLGVNAPEVHGATKPEGDAATAFARAWLAEAGNDAWPLVIQTHRDDAFGRYLSTVWRASDGTCLNDALLSSGHAVPFMTDRVD